MTVHYQIGKLGEATAFSTELMGSITTELSYLSACLAARARAQHTPGQVIAGVRIADDGGRQIVARYAAHPRTGQLIALLA